MTRARPLVQPWGLLVVLYHPIILSKSSLEPPHFSLLSQEKVKEFLSNLWRCNLRSTKIAYADNAKTINCLCSAGKAWPHTSTFYLPHSPLGSRCPTWVSHVLLWSPLSPHAEACLRPFIRSLEEHPGCRRRWYAAAFSVLSLMTGTLSIPAPQVSPLCLGLHDVAKQSTLGPLDLDSPSLKSFIHPSFSVKDIFQFIHMVNSH